MCYCTQLWSRVYLMSVSVTHTYILVHLLAHEGLNWPQMFCLISSWFFTHPSLPGRWVGSAAWHSQERRLTPAPMCGCNCECVWAGYVCESDGGDEPSVWLNLGVLDIPSALQMFWLFLALLCFWFPLVCLEVEGLLAIRYGTSEEVLVKSLRCAPSIKLCHSTLLGTV